MKRTIIAVVMAATMAINASAQVAVVNNNTQDAASRKAIKSEIAKCESRIAGSVATVLAGAVATGVGAVCYGQALHNTVSTVSLPSLPDVYGRVTYSTPVVTPAPDKDKMIISFCVMSAGAAAIGIGTAVWITNAHRKKNLELALKTNGIVVNF